jgi:hypothetical protein
MRQGDFFESTSPATSPIGLAVRCPERPCPECRSIDSVIGSSSGPHYGELVCLVCDRHRGWISKKTHDVVSGIIRHSGRPTQPIEIRIATSSSNQMNSSISDE